MNIRTATICVGILLAAPLKAVAADSAVDSKFEQRLEQVERDLAALEDRIKKRFSLLPSATLWLSPERVIFRTAVPELNTKSLAWVIYHNGRQIFSRSARNEMSFDPFSILPKTPGGYVIFLSGWIDGAHRPISNILGFEIDGASRKPADSAPTPGNSSLPSPTPSETLEQRVAQIEERLSEMRAHEEQQRTLPRTLTLWTDSHRTVYRNVAPEIMEDRMTWNVGGSGQLRRNARGETSFGFSYQKSGDYTISADVSSLQPISNIIAFSLGESDPLDAPGDADNDGL